MDGQRCGRPAATKAGLPKQESTMSYGGMEGTKVFT